MGFPRQEYWIGLPFPSPGDLPHPGTEPVPPSLAGGFFTTEPLGKALCKLGQTYLEGNFILDSVNQLGIVFAVTTGNGENKKMSCELSLTQVLTEPHSLETTS